MNKTIGFKTSMEEQPTNTNCNEDDIHAIIAEEVEQRIKNQQEFQEHMVEFEQLQKTNNQYKIGLNILIAVIIAIILYSIGYYIGAKHQALGNGPWKIYNVDGKQILDLN